MTDAQAMAAFREYAKSFSEADWDEANALSELAQMLYPGLTRNEDVQFTIAGMEMKRANPSATGGEMIDAGLIAIGKPPIASPKPKRKKSRGKLAGAGI